MKRFFQFSAIAALLLVALSCGTGHQKAKYVFYFIGDGMGMTHVAAAEAYLAQERGVIGMDPLCFTSFPVMGEAVSCSANHIITDSSAAGTALSTGEKTKNGMLCIAPDSTTVLKSISYKIHEAGYAVGVMSTTPINHATPASFFGHNIKRGNYYAIGKELPESGFEFFAGGGMYHPNGKEGNEEVSLWDIITDGGYTLAYGYEDFKAKKDADHIVLIQAEGSEEICPYALGRPEGALTLSQIVEAAITVLERNPKGFFMMAEGGLIDWTAHSQDLAGTIFETLDFDQAIAVANAFYERHPKETLIVVTADHETGGLALGRKGYNYDLTVIDDISKASATTDVEKYMNDAHSIDSVNIKANIGWTTYSHSGGPVPVWAKGVGAEAFAARQDNTDIPKKICAAMGVAF
ncbi:MAG: alkaline phosphatase [Bacteroidales bacterium]|nr:alkaline phosphatase [Bacteroidales bacterium]